jgi:hypothetical protein
VLIIWLKVLASPSLGRLWRCRGLRGIATENLANKKPLIDFLTVICDAEITAKDNSKKRQKNEQHATASAYTVSHSFNTF